MAGRIAFADPRIAHVARLGGDTFAVVSSETSEDAVLELAARLLAQIEEPFDIDGVSVIVEARIGIAVGPRAKDAELLLGQAESALDAARHTAGERLRLYEPQTSARQARSRLIERALASAVKNGELHLAYQPQFDLETGCAIGAEALLRWSHPALGPISPVEFIAIAESSGLIEKLGGWVLRQACREAAAWPADMLVAVNVSPLQFQRGDLLAEVRSALVQSGLPPARLQTRDHRIAIDLAIGPTFGPARRSSPDGRVDCARRLRLRILLARLSGVAPD